MAGHESKSRTFSRGRGQIRSGRGGKRRGEGRKANSEMGRAEYMRSAVDKRTRHEEAQRAEKRRKVEGDEEMQLPIYATKFSKEEIDAQDRRPKRKVAVMIGYAGTGYKGMQVSPTEKTIEGDLFAAFVAAGAISKANADNPSKSSLVRCARTDKGVHAAGNVISLKLVIEDTDIVQKINEQLSPQIRVWGIERTNGSFSAYQFCESRIYEYLIPTYCFLPSHPRSFLGRNVIELAEEAGDREGYESRQRDALSFWSDLEETLVEPLFKDHDRTLSEKVLDIFHESGDLVTRGNPETLQQLQDFAEELGFHGSNIELSSQKPEADSEGLQAQDRDVGSGDTKDKSTREMTPLDQLLRHLRDIQVKAKKAYRIPAERLNRVRSTLSRFTGSQRFHNYTIDKTSRDPSCVRVIKSFVVDADPIIINDTEWLSLKVHGQSFMMHQIRKMVSMAALLVRCGCHEGRIQDTYLPQRLSIPKAPSLGLLLERPVFDAYNKKLHEFGRNSIDFNQYEDAIREFKQKQIYERIFQTEAAEHTFNIFFSALDQTRSAQLLFLTSLGLEATKRSIEGATKLTAGMKGEEREAAAAGAVGYGALDAEGINEERGEVTFGNVDEVSSDDEEPHDEAS